MPVFIFGVSRRRVMADRRGNGEAHDGVINISVEPNSVVAGFVDFIREPSDRVAIVRSDGEILAQWPGVLVTPVPPLTPATSPSFFAYVSERAQRGTYELPPGEGIGVVAFRRLQGFPVLATVTRDRAAIIGRWWQNFWTPLLVGLLATGLIAGFAIFSWRRAEELDRAQAGARFHAVFDAAPAGLAIIDATNDIILTANDSLLKLINVRRTKSGLEEIDFGQALSAESVAR